MTVWVVGADSARARIYNAASGGKLTELRDLLHPQSRTRPEDLVSDRPGRRANSLGRGLHGVGGEHDAPHKEEADRFARELANVLDEAARKGRYERLHVIAAPSFLGLLRKHLSNETRKRVASEVTANIATHAVSEIRAHLPKRL